MRSVKPLAIAFVTLSGIGLLAYMLTKPVDAATPAVTPTQSSTTSEHSTQPGTGMFANIAVDIDLSSDVQNTIDVRQHNLESEYAASGCVTANEVVYLGRGGDAVQIGILYRCAEQVWNANSQGKSAKMMASNGADAIIFAPNPAAPLEEVSPVESEFNEIFNLFGQSDLYSMQ